MPQPTAALATLRPDLATFVEFDLDMQKRGYVASQVFPVMNVAKQSGSFGKIPIEQLIASGNDETSRAPGGGYNRGSWTFTKDTYATEEHGWEEPVDDKEAELYAEYFVAEQVSAMRAYERVLAAYENRVAAAVFNATTFTSQTTNITHEWDDATNATPIDNVETAVRAVADRTGIWPNALIINRKVFRNLRKCDQIVDRIASSGAGSPTKASDITVQQLAQCFDLDEIIVAGNYKNQAEEGATLDLTPAWSDEYAMVFVKPTNNDMRQPCLGRTLHWSADGSMVGGTMETYRDERIRGDVVRCRMETDEKMLYVECGQLLDNVTT